MKRKFYVCTFICSLLGLALSFMVISAEVAAAGSIHSEKVSCGKILSDGDIQVFETVECGKEKDFLSDDGHCVIYKKSVDLTKQFKKRVKENVYETKAEMKQRFTFTYDKNENVRITPEDISSERTVTNWKVSPISEISVDNGICSVSNKYRVYERNFVGNFQYMCDGFVDVFCDFNGEIGINSDVRW